MHYKNILLLFLNPPNLSWMVWWKVYNKQLWIIDPSTFCWQLCLVKWRSPEITVVNIFCANVLIFMYNSCITYLCLSWCCCMVTIWFGGCLRLCPVLLLNQKAPTCRVHKKVQSSCSKKYYFIKNYPSCANILPHNTPRSTFLFMVF